MVSFWQQGREGIDHGGLGRRLAHPLDPAQRIPGMEAAERRQPRHPGIPLGFPEGGQFGLESHFDLHPKRIFDAGKGLAQGVRQGGDDLPRPIDIAPFSNRAKRWRTSALIRAFSG